MLLGVVESDDCDRGGKVSSDERVGVSDDYYRGVGRGVHVVGCRRF